MESEPRILVIGESFSPWTKKARWALEYCGLRYDYQEYTPTLSEPGLRWRLRQWRGSVSVPIAFAGKQLLRGSWEIAEYANQRTPDQRLGDLKKIEDWNACSEAGLAEGRTQVVRRVLASRPALEEALPRFVPGFMRGAMSVVARDAVSRLDRKYAHLATTGSLRQALLRTRAGLEQSGSDFLLGEFSYADICMAVPLEVIAPIAQHEPPLGPATQRCWQDPALAQEFADLLAWRDRLARNPATNYSQFRGE